MPSEQLGSNRELTNCDFRKFLSWVLGLAGMESLETYHNGIGRVIGVASRLIELTLFFKNKLRWKLLID